jgi:hypothetical protein
MRDSLLATGALLALFVALPVVLLWSRDRIRNLRHRKSPEQLQTATYAYRQRLLHPNPAGVEASIGGLLPGRLIALYKDEATILTRKLEIRPPELDPKLSGEWIEEFLPLDAESQLYTCELKEWGNGFCFAADGMGNFYWVPVYAERHSDAPVFFACHDPWRNEKISESLDEFLSWTRINHPGKR